MIDNEKTKLLTNITEKLTAFFPTDDNRLDQDYIWEQCKIVRNIFIEKMYGEDKRNIEDFYSRLTLTVLDYDATTETDFPSLKRAILPNLINLQGNIRFLGPTDRSDEYTRSGFDSFFRLQGRDWTPDRNFYLPFKDRVFFSSGPTDGSGVAVTEVEAWVLLEDPEDDPNFDTETMTLVPKKYQLLLEDMVTDNILKYARTGILSRENDATDKESIPRE